MQLLQIGSVMLDIYVSQDPILQHLKMVLEVNSAQLDTSAHREQLLQLSVLMEPIILMKVLKHASYVQQVTTVIMLLQPHIKNAPLDSTAPPVHLAPSIRWLAQQVHSPHF